MGQKIFTKYFGEIDVEHSWAEGPHHLALLTNGAYCHITGQPIKSIQELRLVLTGDELAKAEKWFEHRHDEPETRPRKIMFDADGTPLFDDGAPVESASDLVASLQPGPVLDAALLALAKAKEARGKVKAAKTSKAGKVAAKKKPPKKATVAQPASPAPDPGAAPGASITV